jgi:hypothetical protein
LADINTGVRADIGDKHTMNRTGDIMTKMTIVLSFSKGRFSAANAVPLGSKSAAVWDSRSEDRLFTPFLCENSIRVLRESVSVSSLMPRSAGASSETKH